MFGLEHADNEEEQWSDDFVSTYFGLVGGYCGNKLAHEIVINVYF